MQKKQGRKSLSIRPMSAKSKKSYAHRKHQEDPYLKEIEQRQDEFLKRVHVIILESSRNEDSYSAVIESRRGIVIR